VKPPAVQEAREDQVATFGRAAEKGKELIIGRLPPSISRRNCSNHAEAKSIRGTCDYQQHREGC